MAAYTALLETFARWEKEVHHEQKAQAFNFAVHQNMTAYAQAFSLPPLPIALKFQETAPIMAFSSIPHDKLDCPVCMQPYVELKAADKDNKVEVAIRLPCKHLIGDSCLYRWISPFTHQYKNTCPLCREELFTQETGEETINGVELRVDIEVWRAQLSGAKLTVENHDRLLESRADILRFRLQEAMEELLDLDFESAKLYDERTKAGADFEQTKRKEMDVVFERRTRLKSIERIRDSLDGFPNVAESQVRRGSA